MQDAPGVNVNGRAPQESVSLNGAVIDVADTVKGPVPVFVKVAGCELLGVFSAVVLNVTLGVSVAPGCVPVPLRFVTVGLPAALWVNVTVPESEPSDSGVKVIGRSQKAPAATVKGRAPQVPLPAVAKFPATANPVTLSGAVPLFAMW